MKFTAAAVLAAAVGASAHYGGNATVVTEVVTAYTTYCPAPTEIVHNSKTYTVTEATTLTITDCPCTITRPLVTSTSVVCKDKSKCGIYNTPGLYTPPAVPTATVVPPGQKPGGYPAGQPAGNLPAPPMGTGAPPAGTKPGSSPSSVPTAGAGKAVALSGAGLAGVVGFAALLL